MLVLLYINGYTLGFENEILINSDFWTWNFIFDGLMCTI